VKDYTTKVELAAIPIVALIGIIGVILALAANAGVWAWILVGFAGLVLLFLVPWAYGRRNPHTAALAPVPAAAAPSAATYRVLVVADESCIDASFAGEIASHAAGRSVEALVVAPAIGSWLQRWTDDEGAHKDAQRHLDDTVSALARAGITARGETGANDPLQAADDGMREFAANEIVFVTKPRTNTDWVEKGVIETAKARYPVPVTHIAID
jgi:hypothetical protein